MRSANFFRAAGLIGFLAVVFLAGVAAFLGADSRFRFAQASLIAAPIRFLAAELIVRLRGAASSDTCVLVGRPRRGRDAPPNPTRTARA